ncbi:hypothetical protein GALMADRAFT_131864 [Galerina marginata CBS 339.88]|uniref:Uncharacterized protein n=1 Tax=Galerina marginata (strain CBS 339.88) TaxID=685588 RepID=A0A067TPI9_GALM3|nr:hypothetical protein GALMADRAFT_131864 [Galerina marginata CBS 339.88]
MASVSNLLPTSIALSSDTAIEAILSDIPLFCEGIMGIGVFTFLFITKQVNLLSIFLYGSSFLAFVAATLDLGQVLARGPQNVAKGFGLNSVAGFLYSREVFLSLSVGFLDLFFWKLVARCPREEYVTKANPLGDGRRRKHPHSASWNRWGLIGMALKWTSLAALLSIPLLQILWRLMPGQRKYGSIYVAETTVQTSLMAIFILKLLLNVSICPSSRWQALRTYMAPISALAVGVGIGIGNLVVFSFTESSLGRFLRAVEVYLLILYNLYTTYQDVFLPRGPNKTAIPNLNMEMFQGNGVLPVAYSDSGFKARYSISSPLEATRRLDSWIPPRRRSPSPVKVIQPPVNVSDKEMATSPIQAKTRPSQTGQSPESSDRSGRLDAPDDRPQSLLFGPMEDGIESLKEDRPFTAVSLSYYTMEGSPTMPKQNIMESSIAVTFVNPASAMDQRLAVNTPDLKPPSNASQQGSITSIDDLLRQQTELDKSIAALRLFSIGTDIAGVAKPDTVNTATATGSTVANQSRSTFNSTKTESLSNRSEFSLSVFPDPPILSKNQNLNKDPDEGGLSNVSVRTTHKSGRKEVAPIAIPPLQSGSPQDAVNDSAGTQYDVTSFIGGQFDALPFKTYFRINFVDLTRPQIISPDASSPPEVEATPTADSATVGPAILLRPMLLPSMVAASPSEQTSIPALSASTYGGEQTSASSPPEPSMNLRPFYLGKPMTSVPQLPSSMVPLAQRRQRGGTISSNTRRPVISGPRLNQEKTEAAPGAFERPRPPPLRLNEQRS